MVSVILLALVGWFGAAVVTALVVGAMIARSDADRIPPDRHHTDDPTSDDPRGDESVRSVDRADRSPSGLRLR
ncbi:hypothetical protein [Williamsia sp. CHRR-6]|uniref:hypothetical protein n=1 Tax=Williamsia sp. CHRR-6 TaxID=2835871 RepID=UPI001BDB61C1|nr:hypothetical protein [Williamsia sp. CHRR-6]MBT0566633.1 hypothetical protein [Williamsia sp. CHRR-6]